MTTELLTIPQFCEAVKCGKTYAYQLLSAKKLPAVKLGKKTLIRRADMESYIDSLTPYKAGGRND